MKRSAATDRRSINAQIEVLFWEALARREIASSGLTLAREPELPGKRRARNGSLRPLDRGQR